MRLAGLNAFTIENDAVTISDALSEAFSLPEVLAGQTLEPA